MSKPVPAQPQDLLAAKDQIISFCERIEKLNEDKAAIQADLKQVYNEVVEAGFHKKYIAMLVRLRQKDKDELVEDDELLKMYRKAINI